jgi:hypothetical protein
MIRKFAVLLGFVLFLALPVGAQTLAAKGTITCRAMEVFVSQPLGVTAVIFHQSNTADGPRLGELLLAHTGEEVEFETPDGRQHAATVERVRSCFGRGLLLFESKEGTLAAKKDFVLHFSVTK